MKDIDKETQIPVLLSICSEQLFEGQEPDHIELITEGTLELLPDGLRFFYQETELTGMEGTTTSFQLCGPQVILSRTGAVNSQMVFEEGRQHTSLYETPFGGTTSPSAADCWTSGIPSPSSTPPWAGMPSKSAYSPAGVRDWEFVARCQESGV